MNRQLKSWLASSQDPAQISSRVQGVVIALSSLIIYVAMKVFGIQLTAGDVGQLAIILGTLFGALTTIKGGIYAILVKFGTIK